MGEDATPEALTPPDATPEPARDAPLSVPPLSAAISRGVAFFDRPDRFAESIHAHRPAPFEPAIDSIARDIAQVDPDPDRLSRLKVGREPRAIERPPAVEDAFDHYTPQFFLRNTHRAERLASIGWLDWDFRELGTASLSGIAAALRESREFRPTRAPLLATREVAVLLAKRKALVVDSRWGDLHGRPEPSDSAPEQDQGGLSDPAA